MQSSGGILGPIPRYIFLLDEGRCVMSTVTPRVSHVAERIVDFFETKATRPMRICEVARALRIDRTHCGKLLKNLSEKNIIVKFEDFGSELYRRSDTATMRSDTATVSPLPSSFSEKSSQQSINRYKQSNSTQSNQSKKTISKESTQGERGEAGCASSTGK